MADFAGKKYLVVGGSTGIGLATVRSLAAHGAEVAVWSRHVGDDLHTLMDEYDSVAHTELDVREELDPDSLDLPNELAGVVYAPGSISLGSFRQLKTDQYQSDFDVNVLGAVRVLKHCLQPLARGGGGSVVFFSTVAVQIGLSFHASIAAAKGALEGLAKSLAAELAGKNIRVNVVAPSATDTPLAEGILGSEKKRESSAERHPLKRVGDPAEVGEAVRFLLSDDAGWITGQVLGIDGGLSSLRP
ncbi:MAG: SDR family oxidoreductase [Spirochaetes bacterium]|jgi:NAD(P)-dependent dehydrogenase (short-subunit alcohol dehydrogenase family)|nr:SDR family oxidoreductase [Spirochaetota bacterium]